MESFDVNRRNWDERAVIHAASREYDLQRFRDDPGHLSDVVRFDLPRLGDIRGLRVVHLQCHIGTDTVSLARLGATVTGLDFSEQALRIARGLAADLGQSTDFVHADVYSAPEALGGEQFDLVFTGIGALCWLPDIDRWAGVVTRLLAPGGRLFVREGHPVLWSLDYETPGQLLITYPYFQTDQPIVESEEQTYVSSPHHLQNSTTHCWNHGLGEIVTALLDRGMRITQLVEHDSVPWDPLPGQMRLGDDGEYSLVDHPQRLPLTYTLQALKDR
jgi:ubiquinone/menaquinone biosynthesis C-methylase UbiE